MAVPRSAKQLTAFALSILLTVPSLAMAPATPLASPTPAPRTYLTNAELGCLAGSRPESDDCYNNLLQNLASRPTTQSTYDQTNQMRYTFSLDSYSQYDFLFGSKPKNIIVTIHGLYLTGDQFSDTLGELRSDDMSGVEVGNSIQLTLPGHIKVTSAQTPAYLAQVNAHPPIASAHEWLVALDQTMRIAANAGSEVTIVGQSTGALLAVVAALRFPKLVKRLVLVEPALKVQSRWIARSCNYGTFLTNSSILRAGERLFGRADANSMNWSMGCEVAKLTNELYASYGKTSSAKSVVLDSERIKAVARQIHQAVYVFNNVHDEIVEPAANKVFFDALPGWKHYQAFNFNNQSYHGDITGHIQMMAAAVAETRAMSSRTEGERRLYAGVVNSMFGYFINYDTTSFSSLDNLKGWLSYEKTELENTQMKRRLCEFSKTKADCLSLNQALDKIQSIYPMLVTAANASKSLSDYAIKVATITQKTNPADARTRLYQMQNDLTDILNTPLSR